MILYLKLRVFPCVIIILNVLVNLIAKLGFFINKEKSAMIPTKRIKYLEHVIDSEDFKMYLPGENIEKIINQQVLNNKSNTIRQIARLIGLFTSSYRAINLGALFYRYLERDKVHALAK
jgi:hypothetical protein